MSNRVSVFFSHLYFLLEIAFIFINEMSNFFFKRVEYAVFIERLADKLSKKNILYVKIFQACALNNNFIDESINTTLIKFADQAPWSATADIDLDLLQSFEKEYQIKILNDYTPINAGMISLVFLAEVLETKETLIVKVKRKEIEEKLNQGISHLLFFLWIVQCVPFIKTYGLPEIVQKNINLLSRQTDFKAEVQNMRQFKKICANLKYVRIPLVHHQITFKYPSIILMEYIRGNTIKQVEKEDYAIYAKRVMQFFFITMLMHGTMHGDLHTGNILFLKNDKAAAAAEAAEATEDPYRNQIGILDFGITYEITETKNALFEIMTELCSQPPEETAHKMLQSGLVEPAEKIRKLPSEHYQSFITILAAFIRETVYINKKIQQINLYKFLTDLNVYIANHKLNIVGLDTISPSDDLLKIQVMFGMLHGVVLTLCTDCNNFEFADNVLKETFKLDLVGGGDDDESY